MDNAERYPIFDADNHYYEPLDCFTGIVVHVGGLDGGSARSPGQLAGGSRGPGPPVADPQTTVR